MKKKTQMLVMSIFTIVLIIPCIAAFSLSHLVKQKQNETVPVFLNTSGSTSKKVPYDGNYTVPMEFEDYEKESVENMIKQSKNKTETFNPVFIIKPNPEDGFVSYDIDLPDDMQMHTYSLSKEYEVDLEIVYAIMFHESRFIWDVKDNINTNGTRDRGLMQINEINWQWLADIGLDVNDPYDNIECGIYMLSYLTNKYDTTSALMAYQCGEGGMKRLVNSGYITNFVYEIMDIKENVIKI